MLCIYSWSNLTSACFTWLKMTELRLCQHMHMNHNLSTVITKRALSMQSNSQMIQSNNKSPLCCSPQVHHALWTTGQSRPGYGSPTIRSRCLQILWCHGHAAIPGFGGSLGWVCANIYPNYQHQIIWLFSDFMHHWPNHSSYLHFVRPWMWNFNWAFQQEHI